MDFGKVLTTGFFLMVETAAQTRDQGIVSISI
jgi:hypothetical protein